MSELAQICYLIFLLMGLGHHSIPSAKNLKIITKCPIFMTFDIAYSCSIYTVQSDEWSNESMIVF